MKALLRDPSLLKFVLVYMKIGLVFTLAVLAIYFLFNRSGQGDSPRVARLRELVLSGGFGVSNYCLTAWVVLSMAAAWPQVLYRVIRRSDRVLD
jgi:hypothetical protein